MYINHTNCVSQQAFVLELNGLLTRLILKHDSNYTQRTLKIVSHVNIRIYISLTCKTKFIYRHIYTRSYSANKKPMLIIHG